MAQLPSFNAANGKIGDHCFDAGGKRYSINAVLDAVGGRYTWLESKDVIVDWVGDASTLGSDVSRTPVQVNLFNSDSGHGDFRVLTEIHPNPVAGTYDIGMAIGVYNDAGLPTSVIVREAGWRVGGNLESHEIYDVCQHHAGAAANGALDIARYWPTSRRIGYCYNTFNIDLGNGTVEASVNSDLVRFTSDFPNPDNGNVVIGQYFSVNPNYATREIAMLLGGPTAALEISNRASGVDIQHDTVMRLLGRVQAQLSTDASSLILSTVELVLSAANGAALNTNGTAGTLQSNCRTIDFNRVAGFASFTNPDNTGNAWCSLKLASGASGDLYFGITSPSFSSGQPYFDSGCGFIQYGGSNQFSFNNVNAVDFAFHNNASQLFRVLSSGGFAIPATGRSELPVRSIATLPLAVAADRQQFILSDNNRLAISSGGQWRYTDGTAV